MDYAIIQPPFTLKFRDMPKKELHAYRKTRNESAVAKSGTPQVEARRV
jgi:hypothetical protein